jgi:hypothetical protein
MNNERTNTSRLQGGFGGEIIQIRPSAPSPSPRKNRAVRNRALAWITIYRFSLPLHKMVVGESLLSAVQGASLGLALPHTLPMMVVGTVQSLIVMGSFSGESTKPTPYSKFATHSESISMVPSQIGMLMKYVPSTVYSILMAASSSSDSANRYVFVCEYVRLY